MKIEIELKRARRAGWDYISWLGGRDPEIYSVIISAPLTERGWLRFVLLPVGWICDECGTRVTVAQFARHVKSTHGTYRRRKK